MRLSVGLDSSGKDAEWFAGCLNSRCMYPLCAVIEPFIVECEP